MEWLAVCGALTAALGAAVYLNVRLVMVVTALGRQWASERKDLSDRVLHMARADYAWLEHQREMERILRERQMAVAAAEPPTAAVQALTMRLRENRAEGEEIPLPAHGGAGV